MRGAAAIVVLFAHTSQILLWRLVGDSGLAARIAGESAHYAVVVFFLLSGFLITRSILNGIRKRGRFDAGDYLASRVARIYPPLLGAIGIAVLVLLIIHLLHLPGETRYGLPGDLYRPRDYFTVPLSDLPHVLLMQYGLSDADGPLWTLFIEFQIYLLVMGAACFWARSVIGITVSAMLSLIALYFLRDNLSWVALWMAGAGVNFIPAMEYLFRPVPIPRAIVKTADFSYSLYVMHFPLLMLTLSLSQNWIGHSIWKTLAVCVAAIAFIPAIIIPVAKFLERPHQFKAWILRLTPSHDFGRQLFGLGAVAGLFCVVFMPVLMRHMG